MLPNARLILNHAEFLQLPAIMRESSKIQLSYESISYLIYTD